MSDGSAPSLLARLPRPLRDRLAPAVGGLPRTFWVMCAGIFINRAGNFVVPFLAVYLTRERGMPIAAAGAVTALWGLGAMLASMLGGSLADHIGRRRTMLAALTLGGLGMIGLGFARDLRVIAPAVFLVALLGEAYRPAMQAAVADVVPPEDRVRAFGLVYWVINLGFSIGVFLGGTLASASFLLLFIGDGLTSLAFAALVARRLPETRPPVAAPSRRPEVGRLLRDFVSPYFDGPFGWFVLLGVLILLVFMQHLATLPIDLSAHGVTGPWLGAVLAINGVIIVLLQPWLAPLTQRLNRSRALAFGAALVGLGFGINAVARGPGLFALGVLVWTVGEIFVLPIANAVVADVAPPEKRGRYQGAYGLSFGLAGFGATLIGTGAMQHYGAAALWTGCLVLGLLVAAGHLVLEPRLTRMREQRLSIRHAPPDA